MIAAFFLAATVASPETLMQPSGKWVVEYAESMCVLSRAYGAGADAKIMVLRPYPLSTQTEVVLFTPPASTRAGKAVLRLLPDGAPAEGRYERVRSSDGKQSAVRLTFDEDTLEALPTATGISLTVSGEEHRMAVPGIAAAVRALKMCQADLLKSWDIDPDELAEGRTRPKLQGNPGMFFSSDSYPATAMREHAEGRVVAVLTVAIDGRPSQCKVVQRAHPVLDEATCSIATARMRFSPALDANGKPRVAHYVLPVRWMLAS